MRKYKIPIYKSEREAGIAEAITSNLSLSYLVGVDTIDGGGNGGLSSDLQKAFASSHPEGNFDLYYMKDVLVTTGWNKNKEVFDTVEVWAARHTPEDKPFNFEHRPLDIIGHITASRVIDDSGNEIDDSINIEDLPAKFHIVNGSVLYMLLEDEERKKLMAQTVAEIRNGEWYVSMECLFSGFDYGVIGPDGSQRVIARNKETAFLTKHLAQYGGTGVYACEESGTEYQLGRVLRNITFSGKGLVRRPANPESIILNTVASFNPIVSDLGYLQTVASTDAKISKEENKLMADTDNLEKQVEALKAELANLKSKDMETTISKLTTEKNEVTQEVTKLQATIAERDKTIEGLKAQNTAITNASTDLQKRVETAEAELATVKAAETKRSREKILRDKNATEEVVAKLIKELAVLDDASFTTTVETISASWVTATPKKTGDPVTQAVKDAKPEPEPALATIDETKEVAHAAVVDAMGNFLKSARRGRPSIYATVNE